MKAALLYGPGDIRIETVKDPEIGPDDILVKVKACGICGSDLHVFKTAGLEALQNPIILGHEFSGEVASIGNKVQGLNVGDRVFGTGYRNCGTCLWCRQGQTFRCPNPTVPGEGLPGAFAEYVVVPNPMPGQMLFHMEEGMEWEEAAIIEPLAVAAHAVRRARLETKDKVVILGGGMIGLNILQLARAMGVSTVIVSEPSLLRRNTASKLGASHVANPTREYIAESVGTATGDEMADVVFECSGTSIALKQSPQLLRPYGRLIQVGMFEDEIKLEPEFMSLMFQFKNITWRGSGGQRWDMALEQLRTGQIRTRELITKRYGLDDIGKAMISQLDTELSIKVMIVFP